MELTPLFAQIGAAGVWHSIDNRAELFYTAGTGIFDFSAVKENVVYEKNEYCAISFAQRLKNEKNMMKIETFEKF